MQGSDRRNSKLMKIDNGFLYYLRLTEIERICEAQTAVIKVVTKS